MMLLRAAAPLLLLLRLAEGGSVWPQPLILVRFLLEDVSEGNSI